MELTEPRLPESRSRVILVNAGFRSLAEIGSKIATAALYLVMARQVGDSEFGVFTFALSVVTMVTALGDFGQDVILARDVARDRRLVHRYFANTVALRLALSLPVLLATTAIATVAGLDEHARNVVLLLGLGFVVDLLAKAPFAVFQAHERLGFFTVVIIAQRWLTVAASIVALSLGAGVEAVAAIYFGGAILAFGLAMALLVRYIVVPRWQLDLGFWPVLLKAAVPVGLAAVLFSILFRVDAALLAAFEPDSVVGDYGAAYRLMETTMFIGWSVSAGVFPVFSRLGRSTNPPVKVVYEGSLKLAFAFSLPIAVAAAVLSGPLVLLLYGNEFRESGDALLLLAPTIALVPFGTIASYLLVSQERQSVLIAISAGGVAANIALNLILIPWLSLDGAALATSVTQVLITVPTLFYARQAAGDIRVVRVLGGSLLAAAVAGTTMGLLHDSLGLALGLGLAAYALVIIAFERAVFPEDAAVMRSLLRRRLG